MNFSGLFNGGAWLLSIGRKICVNQVSSGILAQPWFSISRFWNRLSAFFFDALPEPDLNIPWKTCILDCI